MDRAMITPTSRFISNGLYRRIRLIIVVVFIAQCSFVLAEEEATRATAQEERQGKVAESEDKGTKCIHGCERWGKFCNVDPRGVYKCRRRCEKFGEICE